MLTNAEITAHIEKLSNKYFLLLVAMNQHQLATNQPKLLADKVTYELLLFNPAFATHPLTIKQINSNYKILIDRYNLNTTSILINERACPHENEQLLNACLIHLGAISDGFANAMAQPEHHITSSSSYSQLDSIINFISYPILQLYLIFEQMSHTENIAANSLILSLTALLTWQGLMLGSMLATSFLLNPLLSIICSSFLAASAALKIATWTQELIDSNQSSGSALSTDHRFCLTYQEQPFLMEKGYNLANVSEALRECAIALVNLDKNSSTFWHTSKMDILKKVRELKTGYKEAQFSLNGKTFELMHQPQQAYQAVEHNQQP